MSIIEYSGPTTPQEVRKWLMQRTKDEMASEYIRQWREFGKVLEERDALAAHIELCDKILRMVETGPDFVTAKARRGLRMARERCPETSLARRDARMKAEALEQLAEDYNLNAGNARENEYHDAADAIEDAADKALSRATEYRRQAEGGDHE